MEWMSMKKMIGGTRSYQTWEKKIVEKRSKLQRRSTWICKANISKYKRFETSEREFLNQIQIQGCKEEEVPRFAEVSVAASLD